MYNPLFITNSIDIIPGDGEIITLPGEESSGKELDAKVAQRNGNTYHPYFSV